MQIKQTTAELEYQKNPEIKREDISILSEWVLTQPHLPTISELELVLFLHSCKGSIQLTKQTIETYYTMRTHAPDFFGDRDPLGKQIKHISTVTAFTPLPKLTAEGELVIHVRLINHDAAVWTLIDSVRWFLMVQELRQREVGTYTGLVIIFDSSGISFAHIPRINLIVLKKFLTYLQDGMPVRISSLDFVNVVPALDKVLALMKPFLRKELAEAIHLYPDYAALKSRFDLSLLPSDCGGQEKSHDELYAQEIEKVQANRDWFMEEQKLRVDESRRPGKPRNADELYGINGTFKKLDID